MTTAPSPPTRVISHYRLIEPLGEGGMGEVWLAEDTQLPRRVAVKILPSRAAADDGAIDRLLREARAAATVDHPGVVTVYEAGLHEGRPYLVMQHVEGATLEERLLQGLLPVTEAVELAIAIADALAEVHALGIVHRDLKPSNIILTPRGPKILDFGVASLEGAPGLTSPGFAVGTPATMSPEQILAKPSDNRSDLWALGVLLYRATTGRPPFAGNDLGALTYQILNHAPPAPGTINPEVGRDLDYVVMKLLRKDPSHRYARAEDVIADLSNCEHCRVPEGAAEAASRPPRIAVLYFDVLSSDPQDQFLAAGLTEDLIVDLTRVGGIGVAGRAEVLPYRERPVPPRTLGRELGVDFVVHGSVRRIGSRARITVEVVRAADGHVMCGERYDRSIEDLFDMQAEVSRRIVDALQVALHPEERAMLDRVPTRSREAYEYYLRARDQLDTKTREGNFLAQDLLEQALALDPAFALALATLGECHVLRVMTWIAPPAVAEQALEYAERALAIEPDLLEGHLVRAMVQRVRGEPDALLRTIEKVMQLDPNHAEATEWLGWSYLTLGKPELAVPILERLFDRHPDRYLTGTWLAAGYEILGRLDEVERAHQRTRDACLESLRRNPQNMHARSILAGTLAQLGDPEAGVTQGERAVAISPADPRLRYNLACVYARVGRLDDAVAQLEEATRNVPGFIADWPLHDPDLANLREHPKFVKLFGRVVSP